MPRNWDPEIARSFSRCRRACRRLFAAGMSYPEPVARATLGSDWECTRLAFVFTTCSRAKHTEARPVRVAKNAVCARLRT